jgi:hypothetical protein
MILPTYCLNDDFDVFYSLNISKYKAFFQSQPSVLLFQEEPLFKANAGGLYYHRPKG